MPRRNQESVGKRMKVKGGQQCQRDGRRPLRGERGLERGETGSMNGCVYGDAEKWGVEVFEDYRKELEFLGLGCAELADSWARSSSTTRLCRPQEASKSGVWP